MTTTPQPQQPTGPVPQPRPSTPWNDPAPVRPSGPRILPTDAQVADAGRRLDRYTDPDRATTAALGDMEAGAWFLALYLDGRPELVAAHPDLVAAVQRMLAVGQSWGDRYGLAATARRRATDTALGDEAEAWLATQTPPSGGDERPGWW